MAAVDSTHPELVFLLDGIARKNASRYGDKHKTRGQLRCPNCGELAVLTAELGEVASTTCPVRIERPIQRSWSW